MLSWVRGGTYHYSSFQGKTKCECCRNAPCFVQEAPVRGTAGIAITRYSSHLLVSFSTRVPSPAVTASFTVLEPTMACNPGQIHSDSFWFRTHTQLCFGAAWPSVFKFNLNFLAYALPPRCSRGPTLSLPVRVCRPQASLIRQQLGKASLMLCSFQLGPLLTWWVSRKANNTAPGIILAALPVHIWPVVLSYRGETAHAEQVMNTSVWKNSII